jgi:hypothetical protein
MRLINNRLFISALTIRRCCPAKGVYEGAPVRTNLRRTFGVAPLHTHHYDLRARERRTSATAIPLQGVRDFKGSDFKGSESLRRTP